MILCDCNYICNFLYNFFFGPPQNLLEQKLNTFNVNLYDIYKEDEY